MSKLMMSTAVLVAALTLVPSSSEAGMNFGAYPAWCGKYADGSGWCYASMAGFRASSDPNASVFVSSGFNAWAGAQNGSFSARLNGVSYACTVASVGRERWLQFVSSINLGVFSVVWDAAGTCTDAYVYAWSYYQ